MNGISTVVAFSAVVIVALGFTGCEKHSHDHGPEESVALTSSVVAVPEGLFVSEPPPGGRGVSEIRGDETATGEVVIQGRIGGRVPPFVDGAAVFLLVDSSLKSCNELHGDACKTPWDYCCEPRESLLANTATIQVADANGKPLALDIQGLDGMKPLAELTISGEVVQRDSGALVVNARHIHVSSAGG